MMWFCQTAANDGRQDGREYSRINLCRISKPMSEQCDHTNPAHQLIAEDAVSSTHPWYVYLIRTQHGVLYTGISTDPKRRLRQHQGEIVGGAKALRGKGPLQLVWQYQAPSRSIASQWECQLKKLPKKSKEQLVALIWQPDFLLGQQHEANLSLAKVCD